METRHFIKNISRFSSKTSLNSNKRTIEHNALCRTADRDVAGAVRSLSNWRVKFDNSNQFCFGLDSFCVVCDENSLSLHIVFGA